MQLGLRWDDENSLETTRWVTIFFVPILPISRWQVRFIGRTRISSEWDDSFRFEPLQRLPLEPLGVLTTALWGWFLLGIAVGPTIACVATIDGAASNAQMALVFAAAGWPLMVVLWVERRWRRIVGYPPTAALFPDGERLGEGDLS